MGMRSIHKAGLNCGLFNVNVKMYAATESHDTKFHMHHADCGSRISMNRVCTSCTGEHGVPLVVEYGDIVKGIERDEQVILISKDDITALDTEQEHTGFEILEFVHADDVDPAYFENTYYLDADKGSEKAYAVLRQAIGESGRVGIVRYAMRQRTHMGVLRVINNVLAIHSLLWHDEIRSTDALTGAKKPVVIAPKELKLAHALIDSMASDWAPEQYEDLYARRIADLVDTKAAGGEFTTDTDDDDDDPADASDLIAKLEASLAAKSAKKATKDADVDAAVDRHPAGKRQRAKKSA